MQIFQQEYDDGISELISSSKSISYASLAEPLSIDSVSKKMKAFGSVQDPDMYYVQSILVSSNWNRNDDVFDPEEVWKAKETPEHKPTNVNHDENLIVGHIISNYPITEDGILIDKDTPKENLPQKFHILTGAVIYKAYTDPALKERTRDLIASIENGTKYVSMECYFNNFDYGVLDKETGDLKVVARDANSAYLTKYLRAYGGTGEKDNYKIGRVLRNITFSGKGYVDKPANADSIILNNKLEDFDDLKKEESKNVISENKGVSSKYIETHNTVEACIMSKEETIVDEKIETAPAEQAVACDTETVATDPVAEATVSEPEVAEVDTELKNTIAELTAKLSETEEAVAKKVEEEAVMKKKLDEAEALVKKMQAEMDDDKKKLAEMKKKEVMAKRTASLLECGFDEEDLEESLAAYDALDDDAFEAVLAVYKKKMAKEHPEDKKEEKDAEAGMPPALKEALDKKKKEEETKAETESFDTTEEILEEVEETEALDLAVGGEDEAAEHTTKAALVEFVYNRLGKKLNKGE